MKWCDTLALVSEVIHQIESEEIIGVAGKLGDTKSMLLIKISFLEWGQIVYGVDEMTPALPQSSTRLLTAPSPAMEGRSSQASRNPSSNTTDTHTTEPEPTNNSNKKKIMAWEWGVPKDPFKRANIWCKLCDKKICGGITRLKEHLTHTGGNVTGCPMVTTDVTKRVLELMQLKNKKKRRKDKEQLKYLDQQMLTFLTTRKRKKMSHILKKESLLVLVMHGVLWILCFRSQGRTFQKSGKQSTLDKNNLVKENLKNIAWKSIAVWAYSVGLPFNAVRDEGFQNMIYCIGEYGRGMPAPGYYNLRVTLLKDVLEDTKIHRLNLIVGDIGEKIKKIKDIMNEARAVVVYIYNHGRVLNMMRKLTKEEKPCMGYIHDAVSRAKEQITKNLLGGPNAKLGSTVLDIIQIRWTAQLHHPLHASGRFLNPALFYGSKSKGIVTDKEIMMGLYVAIDHLVPKEEDNDTLRVELNHYIDAKGQFGSAAAVRSIAKVAPYTPLLQKFAITVLSQTCSASPCERNWSTFDNLHSKKRNCLLQQKLNDLVYIQYNTRLQRRFSFLQNKSIDPILLKYVEENDEWTIPTEAELQDFVDAGDGLLWSSVREAMGGNVDSGPSTRSTRERYRDEDDEEGFRGVEEDLDDEVNALDDVDPEAEPVDCN